MFKLASSIIFEVEMDLVRKLKNASYSSLNKIGKEEVYSTIRNLSIIGDAPNRLVAIFNSLLTVIACVVYLFLNSYVFGLVIMILIGILIGSFLFKSKWGDRKYEEIRKRQVEYYKYLNDLLYGFKELKISKVKNERIYSDFIAPVKQDYKLLEIELKLMSSSSTMIANYASYFLLAVVLFILPAAGWFNPSNSAAFAIILVYIIGPVSYISSFFPFYTGVKSATKELESIKLKLSDIDIQVQGQTLSVLPDEFNKITFHDIFFEYSNGKQSSVFSLGPINLDIRKGELIFIIGGNGSGKSTFLNLLTGLEKPHSGRIYYNQTLITEDIYLDYRNKMAAVFFEGYLLSNNYETFEVNLNNEKFVKYLRLMKLENIRYADNLFDSKAYLSKGQQKRLALILALLMERELLVLDEWAAEQDPSFKEYFYTFVLPFLKDEGITVICTTHDDQYLSYADRLIKFRDGKVVIQSQVVNDIK